MTGPDVHVLTAALALESFTAEEAAGFSGVELEDVLVVLAAWSEFFDRRDDTKYAIRNERAQELRDELSGWFAKAQRDWAAREGHLPRAVNERVIALCDSLGPQLSGSVDESTRRQNVTLARVGLLALREQVIGREPDDALKSGTSLVELVYAHDILESVADLREVASLGARRDARSVDRACLRLTRAVRERAQSVSEPGSARPGGWAASILDRLESVEAKVNEVASALQAQRAATRKETARELAQHRQPRRPVKAVRSEEVTVVYSADSIGGAIVELLRGATGRPD